SRFFSSLLEALVKVEPSSQRFQRSSEIDVSEQRGADSACRVIVRVRRPYHQSAGTALALSLRPLHLADPLVVRTEVHHDYAVPVVVAHASKRNRPDCSPGVTSITG